MFSGNGENMEKTTSEPFLKKRLTFNENKKQNLIVEKAIKSAKIT